MVALQESSFTLASLIASAECTALGSDPVSLVIAHSSLPLRSTATPHSLSSRVSPHETTVVGWAAGIDAAPLEPGLDFWAETPEIQAQTPSLPLRPAGL